eukprot:s1698_g4.t1
MQTSFCLGGGALNPSNPGAGASPQAGASMFCVACCHCWHEDKSVEQLDISKAESYGFSAEDGEEDEGHAFSVGLGAKDAPSTFIIKLPRATGGDRMMLDKTDVHNVVIRDVSGQLVEWNTAHPDQRVAPYDRLVQINGQKVTGGEIDSMLEKSSTADAYLTVQRPVKRRLTLVRPGKLGVDLHYRKTSTKAWLTNITEGLVLQWNQENPQHIVTAHDRLIAVNGATDLDGVIDQVRQEGTTLVVEVLHYGIGLY